LNQNLSTDTAEHTLSVKVNNYEQAKLCLEMGVNRIYIPCEVYAPDSFMTLSQLQELVNSKSHTEIYLDLPQMMNEQQFEMIDQYVERNGYLFDGLLVSNLGAVSKYAEKFPLITNFNVNAYNQKALEFYKSLGVKEATVSIEMKHNELAKFLENTIMPLEIIVHGPLKVMYLDLNLYENTRKFEPVEKSDNQFVSNDVLVLMTDKGENPVYIDQYMKNHLYTSKELCLLPILEDLHSNKLLRYRIEGQTYTKDELQSVISIYQDALKNISQSLDAFKQQQSVRAGYTLGSLSFHYLKSKSEVPV